MAKGPNCRSSPQAVAQSGPQPAASGWSNGNVGDAGRGKSVAAKFAILAWSEERRKNEALRRAFGTASASPTNTSKATLNQSDHMCQCGKNVNAFAQRIEGIRR